MQLYDTLSGVPVYMEEDVFRVVKEIQDRFPELSIKYLEDDPRKPISLRDAPYIIVENCLDGVERIVKRVWQLNSTLIDELYMMRNQTVKELETAIDKANAAVKKEKQTAFDEKRDAAKDVVKHVLKSPKTSYTFRNAEGELVKVTDG